MCSEHERGFRVNGYFAHLMKFLPFSKNLLKGRMMVRQRSTVRLSCRASDRLPRSVLSSVEAFSSPLRSPSSSLKRT